MATIEKAYFWLGPFDSPITINYETISQSGMKNTVRWTATFELIDDDVDYILYMRLPTFAFSIDGVHKATFNYSNSIYPGDAPVTLGTGTFTVTRDVSTNTANGTFGLKATSNTYVYWRGSGEENLTPSQIALSSVRTVSYTVKTTTQYGSGAQILSVTDFNDEVNPTITYSYDKGSSVTSSIIQLGISFNGESQDIPYRDIPNYGGTYTLELTEDDKKALWTLLANGTTATVRVYLRTVEVINGETMIIKSFLPKTITFENYTPVITPTLYDTNEATIALTGNRNNLIRYMSNVHYKMDVELRKGALDVIGCYIQNGGEIQEGFLEGDFGAPTSNIFYFSATDDRGYTGTTSKSYDVFWGDFINYIKLTNVIKCTPISAEGELSITLTGKYFNAHFGAQQNAMSVQYAVYKNGETPVWSDWQTVTPIMTDNTSYSYTFPVTGLDYTAQYNVAVRVRDLLMQVENQVSVVARPVFYWNGNQFTFNVPVTITEDIIIDGKSLIQILKDGGLIT